MTEVDNASELQAVYTVIGALKTLNADARTRVIKNVLGLYNAPAPERQRTTPIAANAEIPPAPAKPAYANIRSLKDEKAPRSASEMAALVAYYLSELAPQGERKRSVKMSDIKKYFNQAGYRRFSPMTLANAKYAGYVDAAGAGSYSLNPVGYNLVEQSLPATSTRGQITKNRGRRGGAPRAANGNRRRRGVQ